MFKENKEFWLYIVGTIALFFLLFLGMRSYIGDINFQTVFNLNPTVRPTALVLTSPTEQKLNLNLTYTAVVKTNKGDFTMSLFARNAPNTVNNFIYLATQKYFDGTKFHRLVPGVLLQGGSRNTLNSDPNDDAFGGPGYTFADEINWDSLDYSSALRAQLTSEGYSSTKQLASVDVAKYRVAMANAGPNTNGSQFFIMLDGDSNTQIDVLRGRHTVFGEVTSGTNVIDTMAKTAVDTSNNIDRPKEDLVIISVTIYSNSIKN